MNSEPEVAEVPVPSRQKKGQRDKDDEKSWKTKADEQKTS
jgi:hypothetical protein